MDLAKGLRNAIFRRLPFDFAVRFSKQILAAQGFGAGARVSTSGEKGVFRLIGNGAPLLFDVGGHIGDYTDLFLKTFPNGQSYVFEPSASHLTLLRKNLAGYPQVRVFPIGLGAEEGSFSLYKDKEISGLASLSKRRLDHFNIKMDEVEEITVSTVDTIVAETSLPAIDLLKIDVEGHELAVLRGAVKSLERGIVKLVQFEFGGTNLDTHTNLQDFFYFFKTFDFGIGLVQPSGRIKALRRYDEFYEQYRATNFVAAPRATLNA